ncbi:MAG: hypothetical protein KAJ49_03400 [Arcobacteraceae bacterium]|nr:hypothetical protein [Arcobacteraceae bacterium]
MKMILIFLIMMVMIITFVSAQLTKDESDMLINIEKIVKDLETDTICEDIKEIVSMPTISVFGTEYQVGEVGTSFIQLLNDNRQAINDASCFIDAYYPNKSNFWINAPLTYQENSDGLYYKEFTVPDITGLYMLSSACYIPATAWIDNFDDYSKISSYENITVSGGVAKLPEGEESEERWVTSTDPSCTQTKYAPDNVTSGITTGECSATDLDLTGLDTDEIFNVTLIYVFEIPQDIGDDEITLSYCNIQQGCSVFTDYIVYNSISNNTPVNHLQPNYLEFNIGNINYSLLSYSRFKAKYEKTGAGDTSWNGDTFGVRINRVPDPKLSGYLYSEEISLANASGGWVDFNATYNDNGETINFYIVNSTNDTICTGLGNIESCADSQSPIRLYSELSRTANATSPELDDWIVTWLVNGTIREVKGAGEIHISNYVADLTTEINEVDTEVWNYDGTISNNILSQFTGYIWNWTGTISSVIVNAFSIDIWNYENRTVTEQQELWVGNTEYSQAETTGKIVVRMLAPSGDPVVNADCTYSIFYPNNTHYIDSFNMTEANNETLGFEVKHEGIYFADFNLSGVAGVHPYAIDCEHLGQDYFILNTFHTFESPLEQTAEAIWNYGERNLTYTPSYPTPNNLTAQDVWNNPTRDLTYYPLTNITLTNESANEIADAIWNYGGNVSTNVLNQVADKTQCYLNEILNVDDGEWGIDISAC